MKWLKYVLMPEKQESTLNRGSDHNALLQVRAEEAFVSVVTSFAENVALALGLGQSEALALTLASEEVFSHLCRVVMPAGGWIEIRCSGGGYYVQMDFMFPAADFDMRAFNVTATVSLADDGQIEEMGLFLASRSVERFRVGREEGQGFKLSLIKEKAYPKVLAGQVPSVELLEQFSVRTPDSGELKLFSQLVEAFYGEGIVSDFFKYPGKLVDMVESGEYQAAVAVGPSGQIGGGTLWHGTGTKAVEWFGPYLFNQNPDSGIAQALLNSCISAIARTSAVVLINRFPTPEFPRQDFEYLGSASHYAPDGKTSRSEAWARLMREDLGSVVWAHPKLHDFLHKEYARLVLPREIRLAGDQGERHARHSVLMAAFDRLQASVTLQPIWWGEDFEKNLVQHLELFKKEEILNVFFALDLGQSRQTEFGAALFENGFKPCMLLPYAGTADVILFQFEGGAR